MYCHVTSMKTLGSHLILLRIRVFFFFFINLRNVHLSQLLQKSPNLLVQGYLFHAENNVWGCENSIDCFFISSSPIIEILFGHMTNELSYIIASLTTGCCPVTKFNKIKCIQRLFIHLNDLFKRKQFSITV